MTKRGRRRLLLLLGLLVVMVGAAAGGYGLLKWRRGQAVVEARRVGMEAYAEGRYEVVLETLGPYVRTLDQDAEVVRALAKSRSVVEAPDGGHLMGAAALYRRAADLDRTDLESRLALLELLPKLSLLPELIIATEEVLEIDPGNLLALESRVRTFAAMGRWDDAVELAGRIIDEHPEDVRWRQLQVSAAYSAGLDQGEVAELVAAWPPSEQARGLDLAVRGVILQQAGNLEAAMDLLTQAVEEGAGGPESLQDIAGILGDLERSDLAFELFENYIDERGLDAESATILADWALQRGEREWMAAIMDTGSFGKLPRAILASRLALFSMLAPSEQTTRLATLVREAIADSEGDVPEDLAALVEVLALIDAGEDEDASSFLDGIDGDTPYWSTLSVVLCDRLGMSELNRMLDRTEPQTSTLLTDSIEVRDLQRRGRIGDALRRAIEVARRYQSRAEPIVLVATLWGDAPALPEDLQLRLSQLTGAGNAFEILSTLRERFGANLAISTAFVRSAVRANAWSDVESGVEEILAREDVSVDQLLEIHAAIGDSVPELQERLFDALKDRAENDPRVLAIGWERDAASQADGLDTRREQLPLRSETAEERELAWRVLLRNSSAVDAETFAELASEALSVNSDAPDVLGILLADDRTWTDRELTRSIVDRFGELVGDSAERDVAEAQWALRLGTPEEFDRALSRLDLRFVGGERTLPVATTMLAMMLSSDDLNAAAIVRLGRQILQDHPESVEIYPVLISVMQDAGMLEDAEQMLRQFEAIDLAGIVSGRQRAVQSLRTGDFEGLAATMADIAAATEDPDDLYRLALARTATGGLEDAERLHLQILASGSNEFGAASARALAEILRSSGRSNRVEATLSPFAETLPDGLIEVLARAAEIGDGDAAAVDRLAESVVRYPDFEAGWEWLAEGFVASGRVREGVQAARDGLNRFPGSRRLAQILLGACLVEPALLTQMETDLGGLDGVVAACLSVLAESLNGGTVLQPDARQIRIARELAGQYADEIIAWSTAMAIHNAAGQTAECRALAISASRRFPRAPEPVEWRVRSAMALGQLEEAVAACRTWRSLLFPDVRIADETRAAIELSRGQGAAALRALEPHVETIVAMRDRRPGPYRAVLASMLMTGDVRGARRLEGDRFAADPAARTTWARLSTMAPYRSGLEAMSLLEAATLPDPTSRSILIGQWLDFHSRHPEGEGLARARQLLPGGRVEPTDFDSRLQRLAEADIARAEGDPARQRTILDVVISSYPEGSVKSLADVAPEDRGEYILELQPLIMARNNLAMSLLEERRELQRAEELVDSCLEILPAQPQLHDSRAQILLATGRMSEAERSVVIALRGAPGEPAILATAAEVLVATGRVAEAQLALQRVREAIGLEPWPNRKLQARVDQVEALVSEQP